MDLFYTGGADGCGCAPVCLSACLVLEFFDTFVAEVITLSTLPLRFESIGGKPLLERAHDLLKKKGIR